MSNQEILDITCLLPIALHLTIVLPHRRLSLHIGYGIRGVWEGAGMDVGKDVERDVRNGIG